MLLTCALFVPRSGKRWVHLRVNVDLRLNLHVLIEHGMLVKRRVADHWGMMWKKLMMCRKQKTV